MPIGLLTLEQSALWCIITLALGVVSRRSLRNPRCHGFYRFFAFSACAAVVIPNLTYWHDDLFAAQQIASWVLLFAALALVINAMYLLRTRGGRRQQGAAENFSFENTALLVESGIFRFVRHPMYGALMLFAWGVWLKHPTWLGLGLCVATSVFLWLTAKFEEKENLLYFGDSYRQYCQRTKRFIPYLF